MKKLLFVVLILLFGVLMFAAGALAPDHIRQRVERAATHLPGINATEPDVASVPATTPASGPASGIAEVEAETLNLPAPLPEQADYALLAGQFATPGPAQALAAQAAEARLANTVLQSVSHAGERWFVVAVGKYRDLDAARTARAAVARTLGLTSQPPVIVLPPPAKQPG